MIRPTTYINIVHIICLAIALTCVTEGIHVFNSHKEPRNQRFFLGMSVAISAVLAVIGCFTENNLLSTIFLGLSLIILVNYVIYMTKNEIKARRLKLYARAKVYLILVKNGEIKTSSERVRFLSDSLKHMPTMYKRLSPLVVKYVLSLRPKCPTFVKDTKQFNFRKYKKFIIKRNNKRRW